MGALCLSSYVGEPDNYDMIADNNMRYTSHVYRACRSAKAQRSAAARLAEDADDDAENIGPSQPASQRPAQKQVQPAGMSRN